MFDLSQRLTALLLSLFATSLFGLEEVYLKTPLISKEHVIGTKVGIRPFRKRGVRIEAELINDKLIVHNYGYGGSGITLSFGGTEEVMKILEQHQNIPKRVAILGAGVIGLTTAYDLLAKGYEVHIYSNEWSPNLTSNIAAGIWTPLTFPYDLPQEKEELHLRMEKIAANRFLRSVGESPEFSGVRIMNLYSFKTESWENAHPNLENNEIIAHFDNGTTRNGRKYQVMAIDGHLFMNDLHEKVQKNGAILKEQYFASLEEVLSLEEPIIINCTSMGSIQLFNDQEFIPVRGHLVYYPPQEGIDYLYAHNVDPNPDNPNFFFVFLYSWSDRLILGGVYEYEEEEPILDQRIIDTIIDNAEKCL